MVRNARHVRRSVILVTVLVLFVTSISFLAVTQAGSGYAPFQETGTIDISIGSGSETSISTSTSTSYFPHGGGGYVSCTIVSLGNIYCSTDTGTATTTSTETETIPTTTGDGNANASSTTNVNSTTNVTSSVSEFRVAPILLTVTIGLALISLRKMRSGPRHHSTTR